MKRRKIAILGHFGGKETFLDGQTIKTKIYYEELRKKTDWDIACIDTYYKRKNPVKLLLQLLWNLSTRKHIVVLLSRNGRRFFFPILSFFAKVRKVRVYHSLIGAELGKQTQDDPRFVAYLNSFAVNWVETSKLRDRLESHGVRNAELLPNFKKLQLVDLATLTPPQMPYRLCTFSRVMKQKGIEDAIEAVKAANEKLGKEFYVLDIYGQMDTNETQWFEDLKRTFPSCVRYGGQIPYEKSVEVLKDSLALLFPTRFYTEGIPGTIVDAYAAGLPVITARWENYEDVFQEGVTGISYAFGDVEQLTQALLRVAADPEQLLKMKPDCAEKAHTFMPQKSVKKIIDKINS